MKEVDFTLGPRIKEPLHLKQNFLKRIKRKPKQFTLVQSPPDLIYPWIVNVQQKKKWFSYQTMFLVALKKQFIVEFIYCPRLN